ncbi:MAG: lytic transglycosylase domain-containing protein [Desulfovibrionaceae bacterium]|nr:lytic transglycosylase domain-containing protein [Desulfovibrionaceae bacterium]
MPQRLELALETTPVDPSWLSKVDPTVSKQIKKSKQVRIFSFQTPKTFSKPETSLVEAENYLKYLGYHSIYDLSPHAHLLALPSAFFLPNFSKGKGLKLSGKAATKEWESLISLASKRFGLDPKLVAAVIQVESNFDSKAVSPKGAQGAMQIMPATQADLGLKDPFDAKSNILAGCAYLRLLFNKYSNPQLALAAYNAGPRAVDKYQGIPPYAETQAYVSKVMGLWQGKSWVDPRLNLKVEVHKNKESKAKLKSKTHGKKP